MKKILRNPATIVLAIAMSNVPFGIGQVNGSGIGKYVYFAPADQIEAWPTITDNMEDATAADDYIGYTGNFKLKSGSTWIRVYNTQGEGEMSAEPTGEADSKLFTNKLKYRFPKLTTEAAVLTNAIVNGDGVFIAWHDGAYRVIGHKHYRTTVNPNVTSGNTAGSAKGITFEASCPDHKALPIYRGTLELPDGLLNCATDEFTPGS